MTDFFKDYESHIAALAEEVIPSLALSRAQTEQVVEKLTNIHDHAKERMKFINI
jgi:aconitase B